jgi:hypothetical protein
MLLPTCLIVGLCAPTNAWSLDRVFRAGAATSNITPAIGSEIIGGFVPFPSKHIHDELHARCLVLDDGASRIALVVCDLLGIHRIVSSEARKRIELRLGIAADRVMISATHTHSAASALGQDRLQPDQSPDAYQEFVIGRIVDGVARAINHLRPAECGFGVVAIPEHVFNRRWHMRPGTVPTNPFGEVDIVKMNPPAGSADLVEPAGPTDPEVSFLVLREPDGRLISLFATYSLHYVGGVSGADVSSDYYGEFCEQFKHRIEMEAETTQAATVTGADTKDEGDRADRPPFVALLANGTSGDINNIRFRNPRPAKKPYEQIRYVATDVALKVHEKLHGVRYRADVTLDARYREPTIRWRRPGDEQRRWARETIAAGAKGDSDLSYIYAQRTMRLGEYPETTTIPLQVLRIGEVCIGTMPCEVFCEIGLDFKKRAALKPAWMVELAHGYFGYLPTPRQHQLGGYETWIGTNRLEVEASDKLLDTLIEMTAELKSP